MKSNVATIAAILLLHVFLSSCGGDYRPKADGGIEEVIVIVDRSKWESDYANALRDVYGAYIYTLPQPEPFYQLSFFTFENQKQLDNLKKFKNIIIAAPIDEKSNVGDWIRSMLDDQVEQKVRTGESFAFPLKDQWFRDQYVIILTSHSEEALAEKLKESERSLRADIFKKEMERWEYDIYDRLEQTHYSDSLWNDYGWKFRIQHDYIKNIDSLNFVSYRRSLEQNDRWIWAWWKDDVQNINFLDSEWINTTRDSLMQQWIRGSRDGSFVQTQYRRPVETESFEKGRLIAYETLGTWRMANDAMGGPFVNFTYYDPETKRLFMLEFSQFAPGVQKRRYVKQFRVMGRTFESDSLYRPNKDTLSRIE